MSIFNILVETWCSAGHFLWRMAPAIAMNSVTPADTSKKPDLQKLYPLDREVRTVRQRPRQACVCKHVSFTALLLRFSLAYPLDNRPLSCSGFDLRVCRLKKPDHQRIEIPAFFYFFFSLEWQPDYLVGDHSLSWALGPDPCCLGI